MIRFSRRYLALGPAFMLLSGFATAVGAQDAGPSPPALPPRPDKYPVEAFGTRPFLTDPELSPDGSMMAATVDANGKPALAVLNLLKQGKDRSRVVGIGESKILWYRWAGSDQLLIGLLIEGKFYGYDVYVSRLVSYQVSMGKASQVGPKQQSFVGDDVIFVAEDGSHVLLASAKDAFSNPGVYRVDLTTQKVELIQKPRDPVTEWFADDEGAVRAGYGFSGRRLHVIYREKADQEFRKLAALRLDESDGEIDTFRIPATGDNAFVMTDTPTGRFALYEFDWTKSEIGKPIFEHPTVDIDDFSMTEGNDAIEAVYYTDDRERIAWLDAEMQALQGEVDEAMPGRMNWIVSSSKDRKRFIVWTGTASDPGHYYYYNRPAEQMSRVASPYESLKDKKLAPVKAVTYKARDGLEIPAYLTLPVGREAKLLPLVLLPHGGPHARDRWAFDYQVQFLANRGYAILQPNFRGSTGYGKEYLAKGFGQWGGAMQDDLTDGVQWLIREGIVDPKRICIVGASYGGYAALMGAIKTPELFQCAISWAGVTDVNDMMRFDRNQMLPSRYKNWRNRVRGEAEVDLRKVSPVNHVAQIGVPVLLMHGTKDDNVPFRQARNFVKAMEKAGKPLSFIEFAEAGHSIENSEDRVRFLTAIEAFLAEHNPAD
jgi:dipeptidyl aminopeptidase/acylaminoacyl peptidase